MIKTLIKRLTCKHRRLVLSKSRPGYEKCQHCGHRRSIKSIWDRIIEGSPAVSSEHRDMFRDMEQHTMRGQMRANEDRQWAQNKPREDTQ